MGDGRREQPHLRWGCLPHSPPPPLSLNHVFPPAGCDARTTKTGLKKSRALDAVYKTALETFTTNRIFFTDFRPRKLARAMRLSSKATVVDSTHEACGRSGRALDAMSTKRR
jgi:hypothetical protein